LNITGIIWLEDIVEKLAVKHSVGQDEVREVLRNAPRFQFVESGHYPGENLYAALGQTDSGRYLIVYFVHKKDRRALVVSMRDMTRSERRHYEKR